MASPEDRYPDSPTLARRKLELSSLGTAFTLVVVEGQDAGTRYTFDASQPLRVLVGTSVICDVRLKDPSVSRRHVSVEVLGDQLRLLDLKSTNGTVVNGLSISEAWLAGGETIHIGSTVLRVQGTRSAAPRLSDATGFGHMIGQSAAMRRLYPICERLAASAVPVIIEGEIGTGKEQLAQALHEQGPRARGPYVVFDCTAVSPNSIDSELFGHEPGAFPGAVAPRRGVFERAHGGTLLIDEIGDMPLLLQPKLLRAIERSEITRVGGDERISVDVRVLAATRRNLDRAVQIHHFREDLFHRLVVGRVELPPLREREGDVRFLARVFCERLGGNPSLLTEEVLARFDDYAWPGNVRELRNAVARVLVLGEFVPEAEDLVSSVNDVPERANGDWAKLQALSPRGDSIARVLARDLPLQEARQALIDEFEQRYVEYVLAEHDGNVTRAAATAGVARRHLQRVKAKFERKG